MAIGLDERKLITLHPCEPRTCPSCILNKEARECV